jgi:hypothetical protein
LLQPYYDAVGFIDTPTVIAAGAEKKHACLIGTNREDGLIVSFRGSLAPQVNDLSSLFDWIQDFEDVPITADGLPGMVHRGIWDGLESLWSELRAEIEIRRKGARRCLPVLLTGHGKGGGMAHLAAMRLSLEGTIPDGVVSFAAPRVGDQTFVEAYEQRVSAIRYEATDDLVPHLPPDPLLLASLGHLPMIGPHFSGLQAWFYVSAGTLRFIDWNKHIAADSERLKAERIASLALLIIRQQFRQIVQDHLPDCGFAYMAAVCPGVCSEADIGRAPASCRN